MAQAIQYVLELVCEGEPLDEAIFLSARFYEVDFDKLQKIFEENT